MAGRLIAFLLVLSGQYFGQKVLLFKTSDLTKHKIDSVIISQNDFGPDRNTFAISDLKGDYLFVKYSADTLRIEPKDYTAYILSGLSSLKSDTLRFDFLKLNQIKYEDTIIFTSEKRRLFDKTYRITQRDTVIIKPKYKGSDPEITCELRVNNNHILLNRKTIDNIDYEISCNKRASYVRQTRTHEVVYFYHFGP